MMDEESLLVTKEQVIIAAYNSSVSFLPSLGSLSATKSTRAEETDDFMKSNSGHFYRP